MNDLRTAQACQPAKPAGPLGLLANRVVRSSAARSMYAKYISLRHSLLPSASSKCEGRYSDSRGFTITELLVVIILTTLLTLIVMVFAFDLWRTSAIQESQNDTLLSRYNAGDSLREQIGASAGLIIQNSIPDSNTLAPDTSIAGNTYWQPIHAIPGTTNIPASGNYSPLMYFRRYSTDNSKAYIMNGTSPYEDEFILYLDGSQKALMQRTLVNPSAVNDKLKTTCPPDIATGSCPADKVIASDLSSVATRYFSRTGNLIDWTSITDTDTGEYIGPDFPAVEVVEFTLNYSKKPAFSSTNPTQSSTIIRIALRNS
jgi:type II secretory pathway pseudopilin PulG